MSTLVDGSIPQLSKRRKISDNDQDLGKLLFSIKDLFQVIVMGGFISLPEIIRMSLVCKDWFHMISNESYNIFMQSYVQSSRIYISRLSIPNSIKNGNEINFTKDHVKTIYEMMRGWNSVNHDLTKNEDSLIDNRYYELAQQFFTPHLINRKPKIVIHDFPPKKDIALSLLLNIRMENEKFNLENIYRIKKTITDDLYDEYIYMPMIKITRKNSPNYWKDVFLASSAKWRVDKKEVIRDATKNCNIESKDRFDESYYYDEILEFKILKRIRKSSGFVLRLLPYQITHGKFDDVDTDDIGSRDDRIYLHKNSLELDEFFNLSLKKLLYHYFSMNLLKIPICREFIFTLLIHLSKKFEHSHRFSFFHNSIAKCSHSRTACRKEDEKAVMDWLIKYKNEESQKFDEIFHTHARIDLSYYGALEGKEISGHLFVLSLKKDDTNQICNFEFVNYQYYHFKHIAEILS